MSSSLEDLARRNVPSFRPRTDGNGHAPAPDDALTEMLRYQQMDVVSRARVAQVERAQRLAEAQAEAEALKIENDLEEERERQRERRAERMAARQPASQSPDMMQGLIGMFMSMQEGAQARLSELEAKQAEALRAEMSSMRDLVRSVMDRPQPSAVDTVKDAITFMRTIQEMAPRQPEPVPVPGGGAIEEAIRLERAKFEMEMERLRLQRDFAKDDDERSRWEQEMQVKANRAAGLIHMVQEAFPKLTDAVTERVTAGMANGKAAGLAAPAGLPWACPRCQHVNGAPEGTAHAVCMECEMAVDLMPPAGEAPPAA